MVQRKYIITSTKWLPFRIFRISTTSSASWWLRRTSPHVPAFIMRMTSRSSPTSTTSPPPSRLSMSTSRRFSMLPPSSTARLSLSSSEPTSTLQRSTCWCMTSSVHATRWRPSKNLFFYFLNIHIYFSIYIFIFFLFFLTYK